MTYLILLTLSGAWTLNEAWKGNVGRCMFTLALTITLFLARWATI